MERDHARAAANRSLDHHGEYVYVPDVDAAEPNRSDDRRPVSTEAVQPSCDFRRAAGYFPFPAGSPKTAYMWRDIERRAAGYRIPIRVSAPYPAKNSTLTNWITLVGLEEGWGREFALAAYRRWFQLGEETGSDEHVAAGLRDIGEDPQRVLDLLHGKQIQQLWQDETGRARELGVFGSPTFVVRGSELFWGDDPLA
jgi:2-hydroxychromene-2-carboxylate isomerase